MSSSRRSPGLSKRPDAVSWGWRFNPFSENRTVAAHEPNSHRRCGLSAELNGLVSAFLRQRSCTSP